MSLLNAKKREDAFDVKQFNEYLSSIRVEVEVLKVGASKRNNKEVKRRLSKIGNTISDVSSMLLEYTKQSGKSEIYPTGSTIFDGKTLVGTAIKLSLLEIGKPAYEKIVGMLYCKYHCVLEDIYEHPEYLNETLKEVFGSAHVVIIESIKKHLEKMHEQTPIREFLTVIAK